MISRSMLFELLLITLEEWENRGEGIVPVVMRSLEYPLTLSGVLVVIVTA